MKAFLISDNHDTLVLMKLAGIKGVVAHGREESLKAFSQALSMKLVLGYGLEVACVEKDQKFVQIALLVNGGVDTKSRISHVLGNLIRKGKNIVGLTSCKFLSMYFSPSQ